MDDKERFNQIESSLQFLFGGVFPNPFIEVRVIDPFKVEPPVIWFERMTIARETAAAILDKVKPFDKKRNVYIGRNPRTKAEPGNNHNIDWVHTVSFDIDPIYAVEGSPATETERIPVRLAAMRLLERLSLHYEATPVLVDSGNGYQVWVPLDPAFDARGRREWFVKACHQLQKQVADYDRQDTKTDNIMDLPRMIRLPGTWNVRGKEQEGRAYRMATLLTGIRQTGSMDSEDIIGLAPEGNPETVEIQKVQIPVRFFSLLKTRKPLQEAYAGCKLDLVDRSLSGQDYSLVNQLKHSGFTMEETAAVLTSAPRPRNHFTENYLNRTVRRAYGVA